MRARRSRSQCSRKTARRPKRSSISSPARMAEKFLTVTATSRALRRHTGSWGQRCRWEANTRCHRLGSASNAAIRSYEPAPHDHRRRLGRAGSLRWPDRLAGVRRCARRSLQSGCCFPCDFRSSVRPWRPPSHSRWRCRPPTRCSASASVGGNWWTRSSSSRSSCPQRRWVLLIFSTTRWELGFRTMP